jgi:glutaconate CoA-transferase subunit B
MSEQMSFTDTEQNIITTARMVEEDKLYFVQMAGPPLLVMLLSRRLRTPTVGYVVEEGAVAPQVRLPQPEFIAGASGSHYRAAQWTSMNTVDLHAALGYMDYAILAAIQVDRFGNFNSSFIGGSYERPARRFGGPGGANEIASLSWRTILMTKLQRRKFVNKLDFMSSPGFLDGSPGARARAGLPDNTGPYRVVTEQAVFGFDEDTHEMRLLSIAPWTTVGDVLARMEFEPLLADPVGVFDIPGDEELAVLRAEVDPTGRGIRGGWIRVERDESGVRLVEREERGD